MTFQRKLGYESQLSILEFMNPNKRLILAVQCPSLKAAQNRAPKRAENVKLHAPLDEQFFNIGVIRQYNNEPNPEYIQFKNGLGGFQYDVDKYGFEIKKQAKRYIESREDERVRQDWNILIYTRKIELLEEEKNGKKDEIVLNSRKRKAPVDYDKRVLKYKAKRLPYTLRKENQDPPYSHFLQLSYKINGVVRTERLVYNRTRNQAVDYLVANIFGGNHQQIFINKLELDTGVDGSRKWLSLPFKREQLRIRHLKVSNDFGDALKYVRSLLSEESFPLKWINLDHCFSEIVVDSSIINTADVVIHTGISEFRTENHSRVHIKLSSTELIKYGDSTFLFFQKYLDSEIILSLEITDVTETSQLKDILEKARGTEDEKDESEQQLEEMLNPPNVFYRIIRRRLDFGWRETRMKENEYCDAPFIIIISKSKL